MPKQVIVIRKDLNMRKGKMCAQAAHASLKVFLDRKIGWNLVEGDNKFITIKLTDDMAEWVSGIFKKVVVSVDSEAELLAAYEKAKSLNLPCALITDSGLTEFNGVPTNTACAIGPCSDELVDQVTGNLKLL